MKVFLLLVLIWSGGSSSGIEPEEVLEALTSNLDKLSETAVDVLEKIALIGAKTFSVLKFAVPFGNIIADLLDITTETSSASYKMLERISKEKRFRDERFEMRMDKSFAVAAAEQQLLLYKTSGNQLELREQVQLFLDPSQPKYSTAVEILVRQCMGERSGITFVANSIKTLSTKDCSINSSRVFVETDALFHNMMHTYGIESWTEQEQAFKRKISVFLYSMPAAESLDTIKKLSSSLLKKAFATALPALQRAYAAMEHGFDRKDLNLPCLVDAVIYGGMYSRTSVRALLAVIQRDLVDVLLAASLCAQFSFPNTTEGARDRDVWLFRLAGTIQQTAAFLVEHVPKKMNSSETAEIEVARQLVNDMGADDIPYEKYEYVANEIAKALADKGSNELHRQVLITPSPSSISNLFVYYQCPKYWCSLKENVRGINILIARSRLRDRPFAHGLEVHWKSLDATLAQAFYKELLPEDVVKELAKSNLSLVTGDERSRSAAIVLDITWNVHQCSFASKTSTKLPVYENQTETMFHGETNIPTFAHYYCYYTIVFM